MKKLIFVFALLCVAAGTLQAQNIYQWFGAVNSNWAEPGNWYTEIGLDPGTWGSAIPEADAKVKINNVQWGNISEPVVGGQWGTVNASIGDVFIAEAGAGLSPESLHVETGGTLNVLGAGGTAEGQINIAYQAGAVGGLIIDGGTVNVSGPVHVGWGGDGLLSLNNGTMTVNSIDFGGSGGSGLLRMTGNSRLIIRGIIPPIWDPWPIIDPLSDEVTITYDEVTGWTAISTPEPATIALVSLGLVILRKRNR
jgi:hypothetical protein